MGIPIIFEDHGVCLVIQAQAPCSSPKVPGAEGAFLPGPHKYLYLTLNLISDMFGCKVALGKADLPTVQRFLSLQKVKLPVGVYWADVPDQICHP